MSDLNLATALNETISDKPLIQSSNNSSAVTSTNDLLTESLQKTLQTALTSSNSTDASSKFYMFRIFNSESGDWISFPGFVVESDKLVLKKSFEKTENILGSNSYVKGNGADLAQSIEIGEANKFNFDKTMSEIIKTPKKEDKYDFNTKDNSQKELIELKEKLADPKWYPVFTVFEEKTKEDYEEKKEESKENEEKKKEEKKKVIEIKGRFLKIADQISANDNCKPIMDIITSAPDDKSVAHSDVKTDDKSVAPSDANKSDDKSDDKSDVSSGVKPNDPVKTDAPDVKTDAPIDKTYVIGDKVDISNSMNKNKIVATIISVPDGKQINYQVKYKDGTTEFVSKIHISKPEVNPEDNKYIANDVVWVKQTDKNNYKKAKVTSVPNNTQRDYEVEYEDKTKIFVSQDAMVKLKQNKDKQKVPKNEIVYIGNSNNEDKTKATIVSEYNTKNKSYTVKYENSSEDFVRPEHIFIEDLQLNNADSIDTSLLKALNNSFKPESQSINADSIDKNLMSALNNSFKPEVESTGITKVLNDDLKSTKQGGKRDPDRERVYKLPIHKRRTDNYYNYE